MKDYYVVIEELQDEWYFYGWTTHPILAQLYVDYLNLVGIDCDLIIQHFKASSTTELIEIISKGSCCPAYCGHTDIPVSEFPSYEIVYRPLKSDESKYIVVTRMELDEIVLTSEPLEEYVDEMRGTLIDLLVIIGFLNVEYYNDMMGLLRPIISQASMLSSFVDERNTNPLTEVLDPVGVFMHNNNIL